MRDTNCPFYAGLFPSGRGPNRFTILERVSSWFSAVPAGNIASDCEGRNAVRLLGGLMIILGLILLILTALLDLPPILSTIGIILIVVGVVLWILGAMGRTVGPRRYYW